MREALDQWPYVVGVYVVAFVGITALLAWSYTTMRRAEKRREEMKRR